MRRAGEGVQGPAAARPGGRETMAWMGSGALAQATKRLCDIVGVLLLLPIAVPVMLVAGAAVRLESPGGAIFRQARVGRDGRRFTMYKLRTMVANAERIGSGLYAERNDPRFTQVGLFLRRWSIDELPQLFNVLLGEMSLVGPRPMVEAVVEEHAAAYRQILQVRPGLTGLAQVSGRNELARSARIALDQHYVAHWSLVLDAVVLARTLRVVIGGAGQRNDQSRGDVER